MTILLDGIELPDLWRDPEVENDAALRSSMELSRAFTPIVFEAAAGFKNVDLIGSEDAGWMEHSVMESIRALAVIPGGRYLLNEDGALSWARFRNWEGQSVMARPVVDGRPQAAGDFYNQVRIRLMLEI
jgi:hypothetical protein